MTDQPTAPAPPTPATPATPPTMVQRMGGRDYPQTTQAGCHTCGHRLRVEIEEMLVVGATYASVSREMAHKDLPIPAQRVRFHYLAGHMDIRDEAMRVIAERRAERIGRSVSEGVASIVDGITLLETTVQRVYEGVATGQIAPTVRDGLAATKLLAEVGMYDQGLAQEDFVEAFRVYHTTAQQMMTAEQFSAYVASLDGNPILEALSARFVKVTEQRQIDSKDV